MSGSIFGRAFQVATFGESHGAAIGCVIDGCPPRLRLDVAAISRDLARRRPGGSRFVTQRQEADEAEILSGVFEGQTTGAPIALLIKNTDARPQDYDALRDVFRPGHADFAYRQKYGVRDHRGGGRSSARETAARVAAGAIAKQWLAENLGAVIRARLLEMDGIAIPFKDWEETENNPFFAADASVVPQLEERINELRRAGDSCGAKVEVIADNVPAGLGEPVFDKLDADLARALMGINAVKAVEIGAGGAAARMRGSEHNDEMTKDGFVTNNAGGILGGISTGAPIAATIAVKPTSSILIKKRTINAAGEETEVQTKGRHDPCVGVRAVPIAEAMTALVLIDHALRQRGQCGNLSANAAEIFG